MARLEPIIQNGDRVLVVKLADIGDAVLALPAIQAIRAAVPQCEIDVLTTPAGANVFKMSDCVDEVVTLAKQQFDQIQGLVSFRGISDLVRLASRLRFRGYRAVIILHHLTTSFGTRKFQALARATGSSVIAGLDNGRGSFLTHAATDYGFGANHEWQYAMSVVETLGIPATEQEPRLNIPENVRESTAHLLGDRKVREQFAILHTEVGEFSPARAWPTEQFAEVAHHLNVHYDMPVLAVGIDRNRTGIASLLRVPSVQNLIGETTFAELCALVERASLVVGSDSSVAHLAGAFKRPVIALFGPTNIEAWKPFGAESRVANSGASTPATNAVALHMAMPCSPCIYTGIRLGRPQGCRSRACMTSMTPEFVNAQIDGILSGPSEATAQHHP